MKTIYERLSNNDESVYTVVSKYFDRPIGLMNIVEFHDECANTEYFEYKNKYYVIITDDDITYQSFSEFDNIDEYLGRFDESVDYYRMRLQLKSELSKQ